MVKVRMQREFDDQYAAYIDDKLFFKDPDHDAVINAVKKEMDRRIASRNNQGRRST